jgi:peptidoglycan/xylan/chitin deacetylase (PgdA/CDA1 family)
VTEAESKLAVSVDVEDWYHVPAVSGAPFSPYESAPAFLESWEGRYDYLTEPTHRTLELLEDFELNATFFVVADVVENYPGLVGEIADRGHEIGCHGLHHECAIHPDTKAPRFTRAEYRESIEEAKSILESASGQEVRGFRAPNAYVGGWMLDVIEELGFEYDSSVARTSLYNKTDANLEGVGTSLYTPVKGSLVPGGERELVEFPWPYYDLKAGKLPAGGGPAIRMLGYHLVHRGIRQSLERGNSVFYFHPIDIAREEFPSIGNTKRRPGYWLGKGETAEKRIRRLLTNLDRNRLTTCGELNGYDHCREVHSIQ